jgi:hypothetical protein
MRFFDIPVRSAGLTSPSWWNSLRSAGMALENFLGTGFKPETVVELDNAQGSLTDVTDLVFDSADFTAAEVTVEIRRKTDTASSERVAVGRLRLFYRYDTSAWDMSADFGGDSTGVTLSIATAGTIGQVQYTTTNITGTNGVHRLKFKAISFGA